PPKKKGNPIITRYPPPPGYRGPAQPQGPFGTSHYPNQCQPHQPGYAQATPAPLPFSNQVFTAPPTPQGYSPQSYGPPRSSTYPHQPHPQIDHHQWPQQGYPPNQPYPQTHNHSSRQRYAPPKKHYPGYHAPSAPVDSNSQSFGQASGWPPSNNQASYPPNPHYHPYNGLFQAVPQGFDPNATPTPTTAHLVAAEPASAVSQSSGAVEGSSNGEKPQLYLAWDDWDFDFEGAIWPKSNEPVDPNLSLGVITWHPAKQVTRALPSTFHKAEEQASQPMPEKLDNGESVSVYFMAENSHEAFLDVRQTNEWEMIRDDPVFVVFNDQEMRQNLLSWEDCLAQANRPDEPTSETQQDHDKDMPDVSWSIMDHLEKALSGTNEASQSKVTKQQTSGAELSQEDVLAKLGVTGDPKPLPDSQLIPPFSRFHESLVSFPGKPGPMSSLPSSSQALPRQRVQSYGAHKEPESERVPRRPCGLMSFGNLHQQPILPPPPPPETKRYTSWNQPPYSTRGCDDLKGSPARSEGSNHTMAGSDFESEKLSSSAEREYSSGPTLSRSDSSFSRKRSYEDADHSEKAPQHDDHTKRKRRSQVDAAYR
ncbi:hypothetical protein GQ44DRAFT_608866, partial [Phaeosphaeriaceae sp. PMI808]